MTFDVTVLDGSPVWNAGTNHLVGADRVMFRAQYQIQH